MKYIGSRNKATDTHVIPLCCADMHANNYFRFRCLTPHGLMLLLRTPTFNTVITNDALVKTTRLSDMSVKYPS